jgi:ssDNA-binding Zn-finger/Zn-ribbon topoisomerase 1
VSLIFHTNEPCPNCNKPMAQAVIERHPMRNDLAVRSFYCANCGPVKTLIISLGPGEPPPEFVAKTSK